MAQHNDRAHCNLGGSFKNNVGYCKLHRCNVTLKQMKNRKCLQKGCRHFRRHDSHPYWEQRKALAEEKRKRKELRNGVYGLIENAVCDGQATCEDAVTANDTDRGFNLDGASEEIQSDDACGAATAEYGD